MLTTDVHFRTRPYLTTFTVSNIVVFDARYLTFKMILRELCFDLSKLFISYVQPLKTHMKKNA